MEGALTKKENRPCIALSASNPFQSVRAERQLANPSFACCVFAVIAGATCERWQRYVSSTENTSRPSPVRHHGEPVYAHRRYSMRSSARQTCCNPATVDGFGLTCVPRPSALSLFLRSAKLVRGCGVVRSALSTSSCRSSAATSWRRCATSWPRTERPRERGNAGARRRGRAATRWIRKGDG